MERRDIFLTLRKHKYNMYDTKAIKKKIKYTGKEVIEKEEAGKS